MPTGRYSRSGDGVPSRRHRSSSLIRAPPRFGAPPPFKPDTVQAQLGHFDDVPLCMPPQFHHPRAAIAYHRYYLHKLHTVPKCARWYREQRRAMHRVVVVGMLQRLYAAYAALKRKRLTT
mgnify:CR=1 FL=1